MVDGMVVRLLFVSFSVVKASYDTKKNNTDVAEYQKNWIQKCNFHLNMFTKKDTFVRHSIHFFENYEKI